MYEVTREFEVPVGHILVQHDGKCRGMHGHELKILVTLQCESLNSNYMILDFGDLKGIVGDIIESLDHGFIIDEKSTDKLGDIANSDFIKLNTISGEPTAENLAKGIYQEIRPRIDKSYLTNYGLEDKKIPSDPIYLKSVTVYENSRSSSTYYPS